MPRIGEFVFTNSGKGVLLQIKGTGNARMFTVGLNNNKIIKTPTIFTKVKVPRKRRRKKWLMK